MSRAHCLRLDAANGGITLIEILTALVALVVLVAVALPLWRTHELRTLRRQAMDVLQSIETAQDRHFAAHGRYPTAETLNVPLNLPRYTFDVQLAADALGYVATAHAVRSDEGAYDGRCARMSIDQHGRRSALDDTGKDTTADCWRRK